MAINKIMQICFVDENGFSLQFDKQTEKDILEARSSAVTLTYAANVLQYQELMETLGIDDAEERHICDDIVFMQLFRSAWTCELRRLGYKWRVIFENIHPDEAYDMFCIIEVILKEV